MKVKLRPEDVENSRPCSDNISSWDQERIPEKKSSRIPLESVKMPQCDASQLQTHMDSSRLQVRRRLAAYQGLAPAEPEPNVEEASPKEQKASI